MLTSGFEAKISVKILKAKRVIRNGHFCPCPNSKGDILQKAPTFFLFNGYPNLKDILLNARN